MENRTAETMESPQKKQKKEPRLVIIEPVLLCDNGYSKPLGYDFGFLDQIIPAEDVQEIKHAGIHEYFCNWILEHIDSPRLRGSIDYIGCTSRMLSKNYENYQMVEDMISVITKWLTEVEQEAAKSHAAAVSNHEDDDDTPTPILSPKKAPNNDDVISKKYIRSADCMIALIEIMNHHINNSKEIGDIRFLLKEVEFKN
jgi:hypothetical protein